MKEISRVQRSKQLLKRFLKRHVFSWQYSADLYEDTLMYSICTIVVSFIVIGIILFARDEYTASSIFILTAFLFVKDVIARSFKINEERKALERDIDSRFHAHYGALYEICTCKDCIFRFSCTHAYGEEETSGRCSLKMYKKA